MSGLKLAILYGLKPHQLGFCGPKDNGTLLRFLKGDAVSENKIRKILEQFAGAYPYYKQIAKNKNIKDPFDERVVREYWLIQHIYHVLVIGSVTGRIVLKGKLLDLCRIGWGKVEKIKNQKSMPTGRQAKIKIKYQPLTGNKLGKPIKKEIDWDKDLVPNVKIGDWVSFHWNQAVEVLSDKDRKNLEKYTKLTLKSLQK